MTVSMLC